jgi:hypothetical protein
VTGPAIETHKFRWRKSEACLPAMPPWAKGENLILCVIY